MPKTILAAFDQGQIPTISCVNLASVPLGVEFDKLINAMQVLVDKHFAPVWGTPYKLTKTVGEIPPGNWALVFTDNADVANALGYHDLTPDGFPLSHVFVKTTLDDGAEVSVTASHELVEMLVDPGIQMGAIGPKNVWYAYETADAVERLSFAVNGINMSDFVYPSWFEGFHKPGSTQFDHLGKCKRPFQILTGGYMPVFVKGRWTQIFGSAAAKKRFQSRSHPRTSRRGVVNFKRSRPKFPTA